MNPALPERIEPSLFGQHDKAVHFYLPSLAGGGAERVFIGLANHFAARGINTHLVVNAASGPLRELVSPQVQLHSLGALRTRKAFLPLVAHLRAYRPDVIYSALFGANLAVLFAEQLARSGARIIVSERNHFTVLAGHWSWTKRAVFTTLIRWVYRQAHWVTAVAGGVADDIARVAGLPRERVAVVYNPAPGAAELADAQSDPSPDPWFDEAAPVLVAAGRLMKQKDYPSMLAAFAKVRAVRPARLIILGEGPLLAELEALAADLGIADSVRFAGFKMNRFSYMARADILLLSSVTEGFPNVLVEAMACGTPVISTDCAGNGPREILGEHLAAALVPVADIDAMEAAILHELDHPSDPRLLEATVARFSIDAIADQYARLADA